MAIEARHHVGETDPAIVIASSLTSHGWAFIDDVRAREMAAAIVADVRAAGFGFSRKLTKAECDDDGGW